MAELGDFAKFPREIFDKVLAEVKEKRSSTAVQDLSSLARTSKSLYHDLNLVLYQLYGDKAIDVAVRDGNEEVLIKTRELAPDMGRLDHLATLMERGHSELALKMIHSPTIRSLILSKGLRESPIFEAVKYGHTEIIDRLLDVQPVGHNVYDGKLYTMLYHAREMGHLQLVRRFLNEGAEALVPTEGEPLDMPVFPPNALAVAIKPRQPGREKHGDIQVVAELVQNPDLLRNPLQGQRHLGEAVGAGRADIVNLLLQSGATIPADDHGVQLLRWAIWGDSLAIIKMFLEQRATTGSKNPLLRLSDIEFLNIHGTALCVAASTNRKNSVKIGQLLLDHGASISETPRSDPTQTPLSTAVKANNLCFARFLLELGAAHHQDSATGPDIYRINSMEMLNLLIDYGLDINMKARNGQLPIQNVVGSSVPASDNFGRTALHGVMDSYLPEVEMPKAKLLLAYGANPDARCQDGVYALRATISWMDDTEVVRELADLYLKAKTTRLGCPLLAYTSTDKQFIKRKDKTGRAGLADGFRRHRSEYTKRDLMTFIELGANIDEPSLEGYTPLTTAVTEGRQDLAQFLIDQHANVNAINDRGQTMLDIVLMTSNDEDVEYHIPEEWGALLGSEVQEN